MQPVVYIPFGSCEKDNAVNLAFLTHKPEARNIPAAKTPMSFPSGLNAREVSYGSMERYMLYQEAWAKCENEIIVSVSARVSVHQ